MDSKDATNLLSTKTLVKFGLNRQPFMDKGSNRYAFEDSAISTQLNVLINIIHGSDKIVMIKGENGIGKSSLLFKLAKTRHKGLTFCPIKATDKITIEGICKLALKQLEIQPPGSNASIPEFFAKRVAFRRRTEGKTVLLIDDADQLDSYTIDQLLLLRKLVAEDGVPAISIVFAGHPQLEQILTALPRINNHLSILHTIYLYPFSEKQTADYINQRLQFANNNNDVELLTTAQIQSIHNKAKGIPTLINYETCRILENLAGNKQKSNTEENAVEPGEKGNKLIPAALITVATCSLAFLGYLIYGHFQFSSTETETTTIVASTTQLPAKTVTQFEPEQPPISAAINNQAEKETDSEIEPAVVAVEPVVEPVTPQSSKDGLPAKTTTLDEEPVKSTPQQTSPEPEQQVAITKQGSSSLKAKPLANEISKKTSVKPEAVKPVLSAKTKQPEITETKPIKETKDTKKGLNSNAQVAEIKKPEPKPAIIKSASPSTSEVSKTSEKDTKPTDTQKAKPKDKQKPNLIAAKPIPKKELKQNQALKQAATAKPAPAKPIPTTEIKQRPKSIASTAKDNSVNSWIKSQPPLNYTMQLLAAQDDAALKKYRNKYPSLKEAKIAHTLRKGKEWFVLIIGSFKTTKEANEFLQKQPKPLKTSKPWIRRFKPLQNTLK